ncbi:hypothetical protein [Pinirhizobacter soli]|uniref:hypothetical protein n=1 Tax=Pinirhizobacter soli TaxID=2786953 RepID=UPI00202A9EA7|nr:hypothetical protein [Pinirhizobacter soli]
MRKLLAGLAFFASIFSCTAIAGWPTSADTLSKKLVFAEFHPWAATPSAGGYWLRWNETGHNPAINDILSTVWPLQGPYSEADCTTVQRQVGDLSGQVTGAGVDVLLIDWVNVYAAEQDRVSNIISCSTMPVVVMVDVNWTLTTPSFSDAITRLETAIGWFATRQDLFPNYYRDPVSGQPVFFVFDPGTVGTVAQWNSKIDFYKTLSPRGIFVAGTGANTSANWILSSHFDGMLALAGKTPNSDEANFDNALSILYGSGTRSQFLIAESIPGFNDASNCGAAPPVILDREAGQVFDRKWAGLLATNWNGHKLAGAYVIYNNDGEDAGIEPASPTPPTRGSGYACVGVLSPSYKTYAPLPATYYLDRNAYWANQFRSSL